MFEFVKVVETRVEELPIFWAVKNVYLWYDSTWSIAENSPPVQWSLPIMELYLHILAFVTLARCESGVG